MPTHFRTSDREAAAHILADRFPRVLIRTHCYLWNQLRMKRLAVSDLSPFIVRTAAVYDAQLKAWDEAGGVCLFERMHQHSEALPRHHAQLLAEAPPLLSRLALYTASTSHAVAIFKPPSWDEHLRYVDNMAPPVETCRKLFAAVNKAKEVEVPGFGVCRVVPNSVMVDRLGVPSGVVTRMRNLMLPARNIRESYTIYLRQRPDRPELQKLYDYIEQHVPATEGAHLVVGNELRNGTTNWRAALRILNKRGYVNCGEIAWLYRIESEPNWAGLQTARIKMQENVAEAIDYYESLLELA